MNQIIVILQKNYFGKSHLLKNRTYILLIERSKDEEKTYCERTKVKNERYFGIVGLQVEKEPK